MKNRIKEMAILMMGAIAVTGCPVYGLYPFVAAYFAAFTDKKLMRNLLVMLLPGLLVARNEVDAAVKYGVCILAVTAIYEAMKRSNFKIKIWGSGIIMGGVAWLVEMAGVAFISPNLGWHALMALLEAIVIASFAIIFNMGFDAVVTGRNRRFFENREMVAIGFLAGLFAYSIAELEAGSFILQPIICLTILIFAHIYGTGMGSVIGTSIGLVMLLRTGDMAYFGVFCLLGAVIGFFNKMGKLASMAAYLLCLWFMGITYAPFITRSEWVFGIMLAAAIFMLIPIKFRWNVDNLYAGDEFEDRLKRGQARVVEAANMFRRLAGSICRVNKGDDAVFATGLQLSEAACILEKISDSMIVDITTDKSEEELQIKTALERKGYAVKSLKLCIGEKGETKIATRLCSLINNAETVREVIQVISAVTGKNFRPSGGSRTIVGREFSDYSFIEEPEFMMLYSTASRTKDGEEISGDSFTYTDLGEGDVLLGIVDGMGSGTVAGEESELVIELLEELLKAGFEKASALELINSMLITRNDERSLAALDMAVGDLYTGRFEFVKLGAAATFIKRNRWVEILKSTNYPIGILKKVDYENTIKKLYDGDYIVMVSDGVLDAVGNARSEEVLSSWIAEYEKKTPGDFADYILDKAIEANNGVVKDDMTVLVAGVWAKNT